MWQKFDRAALVLVRRVRALVVAVLLTLALAAIILGLDGTNDANWTAAMVALCAATLLVLGARFERRINAPAVARAFGVVLAIPAAWFWFVSAHDPGTPQWAIGLALVSVFTASAILVVLVALYIWLLRWRGPK